ncbi:hypothetical protein [Cellulomonas humilata]|uniref:DUF1801 domain-containing protein n=1 Tax=Cellulomonas humilata TaxID=144055 RepID=A0ABU0EF58_9CELL|nr:hypothetical protein [Cellulomonas humilata]MDQ0373908.1 hypothetical protein [Cellulomonas humilata]
MPANARSIELIRQQEQGVTVYDGGPSRNRQLDKEMFALLETRLGGTAQVRMYARMRGASFSFLEADWVASSVGVHYVHYNAGAARLWAWTKLSTIEPRRNAARLHFPSGRVLDLGMNRYAAHSLAEIAARTIPAVNRNDD